MQYLIIAYNGKESGKDFIYIHIYVCIICIHIIYMYVVCVYIIYMYHMYTYHMYTYHTHHMYTHLTRVCIICIHIICMHVSYVYIPYICMYHVYTYHTCMYHMYTYHIHVCVTESFCSTPEINTLYINHNSILKIIALQKESLGPATLVPNLAIKNPSLKPVGEFRSPEQCLSFPWLGALQ